jgi:type I restriction enzyme S subunit
MNKKTAPELPQGWEWTTLGEICLNPQYGWTTSAKNDGCLHLLRTTDITSGNIDWDSVPFCKKEPVDKEKYLLIDNDIVISRAGSVGYSHLIKNPKGAVFASYLIRFKPLIDEKYTSYFLKSPSYWNSISEKSLGIAVPNVNATKLKQISIPLPPPPSPRTAPHRHQNRGAFHPTGRRRRGAHKSKSATQALPPVRAQVRVRGQARAHRSRTGAG